MSREILVVKRDDLFQGDVFQGFCPLTERDFSKTIADSFTYQERTDALEEDKTIQQIIPYVWIINKKAKTVFLYKRSTDGDESRLHNKFSGGVGGHIDKDTDEQAQDPVVEAMMRELKEELTMQNYPTPKFVGFLNDDSSQVGSVHFGVVAIAETEEDAKPAHHMEEGRFYTIKEAEELINKPENDLESWSQFSWPFVKSYLMN